MTPEPQSGPDAQPNRLRPRRQFRTSQEVQQRRRRLVSYGLLFASAVLMVSALVGDNGYLATLRARQEREALTAAIVRLQSENQQLLDQARRLREDPSALEEAARMELGLVRPGETLVIIRDAPPLKPALMR